MSVHVEWENESHTAIRHTFESVWRWQDYDESVVQIRAMMRSVQHTVHVISDIRAATPHTGGLAWQHFQRALTDIPHNTGMLLVAGKGHFTASIFSLYVQAAPNLAHRTRFVATIAEAHSVLKQHVNPLHVLN